MKDIPLQYAGQRRSSVSGHYLLGNGYRGFNPILKRFAGQDSYSPFGAGGANGYAYCGGNPVNHTDPSGHLFWEEFLIMIMDAFIDTSIATDAITDSVGEAAGEVIGGAAGSTHYRGMASENNPLANEIFNGAGWKSSGNNIIFANGAAPSDVISFWKSQITSIKKRRDFERRNFAFMVFRPTGESKDFFLFSISGNKTFKHVFEQIPAFPQERSKAFDVFDIPEGHYRGFDTESKLLEHFNNYTDKNVSGTMYLYSERVFCDSCSNVINNFVREFKNIRFIGVYGRV